VVSILGRCFFDESWASGMISGASLATHWLAPAGLCSSSYSNSKRFLKNPLLHWVGVDVQVTSRPEVMASRPLPVP
jgi:hypothetical protein